MLRLHQRAGNFSQRRIENQIRQRGRMRPCPIFKNISIRVLGFGVIPEKLTWLLTILLDTLPRQIDIAIIDDISEAMTPSARYWLMASVETWGELKIELLSIH
jgi:hypothetical protein